MEQRLQEAIDQAEEAGFRIPKKEEPAAKAAKREKTVVAK
jgi:hypothetical protein